MALEMMELSMPDFDARAVSLLAEPPRATTDEAVAAADEAADSCEVNRSAWLPLPVEMKKSAENAMARVTNFFLNCSLFDTPSPLPRIL